MIVRHAGESLLLITQPDHAALARRVMEQWTPDGLPDSPRRESILLAVGQHDNGWLMVDAAPIVLPDGRIADFVVAPGEVRRGVWPRAVATLAADPSAAALVAQHAVFVYSRFESDPEWLPFFTEMKALREHHRARAGLDAATLQRDYDFVRLGDLISLTFCNPWTDRQQHGAYSIIGDGTDLVIEPDPFGGARVPLEIRARRLPNRAYAGAADAARAWEEAGQVIVAGSVSARQKPRHGVTENTVRRRPKG
jgi:hypothetical protein